MADPHADPHGETSGWKQWKQEGQRALISEQKVLKTSRNRYFYIFSTLRNQQVAGSSPSTSSNLSAAQQSEYGGIPEWQISPCVGTFLPRAWISPLRWR